MKPRAGTTLSRVGVLASAATFAMIAGTAFAQSAFVKVGPETVYDAGDRCGVPFWDVADFNRDGRPDFALFGGPILVWSTTDPSQWKPAAVMLWVAQPDGSYKEMASQMFNGPVTAAYASQLRVGDFNGDGIPDIYLPSYGLDNSTNTPDTPKLALSTPGGFVDASAQFANLAPRLTHTGAIADIDGNGTIDLYVGSNTGAPVGKKPYLLVNDGSGNFTYTQALLPTVVLAQQPIQGARSKQLDATRWYVADERFLGSEFADVNRDGYPDLILEPGPYAPNGFVFLNDRLGDFSKLPPIELPPGAYGGNWLIAELENGGWFASPPTHAPGPGTIHLDTRAVELNGDGYPDLVVLQNLEQESPEKLFYRGGRIQILINQGGRGFVDESAARGAPGFDAARDSYDSYHSTLTVADVNGDGFPDLIAIRVEDDFTPHVFLNDGNGRFTRITLAGILENGLFIVVSGGFRQPTRLVNVRFNYRNDATARTGCTLAVQAYERPAAVAATKNYQGLWFAAPARSESGWGINFAHQGDTIFATWFTYGLDGKPWWLAAVAHRSAAGVYTGDLFTTTGPPFNAVPFNPAAVVETTVGSATFTFTFTDINNGTFAYSIDPGVVTTGVIAQTKSITRQLFGPSPTCVWGEQSNLALVTGYQDLWYNAPPGSESGWGINFTHQGDIIFATWFTYDLNGKPWWLGIVAKKTAPGVYSGDLFTTSGPPFNAQPFDPAKVVETTVGTGKFTVRDGNNVQFDYTVNGVTQSKALTRQVFAAPGTMCQ